MGNIRNVGSKPNKIVFSEEFEDRHLSWRPCHDESESHKAFLVYIGEDGEHKAKKRIPFFCLRYLTDIFFKDDGEGGYKHRFHVSKLLGIYENDTMVTIIFMVYRQRISISIHKFSRNVFVNYGKKGEGESLKFKTKEVDPEEIGIEISRIIRKFGKQHHKARKQKEKNAELAGDHLDDIL